MIRQSSNRVWAWASDWLCNEDAGIWHPETPSSTMPCSNAPRRLTCATLLQNEDGMVTWATLFLLLFFAIFAQMIVNVSTALSEKMEAQNAADATAVSGAVWMARSMNAVTAANHMMGELTALYVLHHSIGAEHLDDPGEPNDSFELEGENLKLKLAYEFARTFKGSVPMISKSMHEDVLKNPAASQESTVYQSQKSLKSKMFYAYIGHGVGGILERIPFPPVTVIGMILQGVCAVFEVKIWQEYVVLDAFETVALNLSKVKQTVIPAMMKAVWIYENGIVAAGPLAARQGATAIARQHGMVGELVGEITPAYSIVPISYIPLPVEKDPSTNVRRSQLMRATYPWVHYWREPILEILFKLCTISMAANRYLEYTDKYTEEKVDEFQEDKGYRLLVINGVNAPEVDKSQESWATEQGSAEAEKMFCCMAYVRHRNPPNVFSPVNFRQWAPGSSVAFAQSMYYNASHQQDPAGSNGVHQPHAGWDTLNWQSRLDVVEFPYQASNPTILGIDIVPGLKSLPKFGYSLPKLPPGLSYPQEVKEVFPFPLPGGDSIDAGIDMYFYLKAEKIRPRIQLNWRAKLTPVTTRKLTVTTLQIRDEHIQGVILQRASPLDPATHRFLTH